MKKVLPYRVRPQTYGKSQQKVIQDRTLKSPPTSCGKSVSDERVPGHVYTEQLSIELSKIRQK